MTSLLYVTFMLFPLRLHVQTTAKDVKGCHIEEIMETLENMEDLTLTLLKQIVTNMAKVAVQLDSYI